MSTTLPRPNLINEQCNPIPTTQNPGIYCTVLYCTVPTMLRIASFISSSGRILMYYPLFLVKEYFTPLLVIFSYSLGTHHFFFFLLFFSLDVLICLYVTLLSMGFVTFSFLSVQDYHYERRFILFYLK